MTEQTYVIYFYNNPIPNTVEIITDAVIAVGDVLTIMSGGKKWHLTVVGRKMNFVQGDQVVRIELECTGNYV